jgi:hypothetical protein
MSQPYLPQEPPDFSLVLGGPTFQLLRRAHIAGDHLELLHRRMLVITGLAWLPLCLLVLVASPDPQSARVSFLRDVDIHVRLLVALPVLIASELIVHTRLRLIIRQFVERRIVFPEDLPRFQSLIESALRLRNSVPLEIALAVCVYTFGVFVSRNWTALDAGRWYSTAEGGRQLTPAGFWYVVVSLPIVQFILLRWYLRLFIWFRLLWQISRGRLNLIPTHPDRCAGLAFLGESVYAFQPILFAQGAMLGGLIGNRVINSGASLLSFRTTAVSLLVFLLLVVLGPLLMFAPTLSRTKRHGLIAFGLLAQRFVENFDRKWGRPNSDVTADAFEPDIDSLALLGESYSVVREMGVVPFGKNDILALAVTTTLPLLPLVFTIWSPQELLSRVIKIVM